MKKLILILGATLMMMASDQIPAKAQAHPIALVGATIVPVEGAVIEAGTLLFDQGKIVAMGKDLAIPEGAERRELKGKFVYPALINASTSLGLAEIGMVLASVDTEELGDLNPNVASWTAVNPDSEIIPVARESGTGLAAVLPRGTMLVGMGALMRLDGWSYEDMVFKAPLCLLLNWPDMRVDGPTEKARKKEAESLNKRLTQLDELFGAAKAYEQALAQAKKSGAQLPLFDSRLESMGPFVRREAPVWIQANRLQQIEAAVAFSEKFGLKLVLLGAYDSELAAPLLKEHKIPVILRSPYELPLRDGDDYDKQYRLAGSLYRLGIPFCIAGEDSLGQERTLPYGAGSAIGYGLPRDQALRAITLSAAEILGVAERVGSLKTGKDATLIITDGDPLEITTIVEELYIEGRKVDLDNKQRELYRKYQQKYAK